MTDMNPQDAEFGRAAQHKQEEADRLEEAGVDPVGLDEREGADPRPRAGGKASEGAPSAARIENGDDPEQAGGK